MRHYLQHRLRCSLCGHIAEAKDDISLRERLRPEKKVSKESEEEEEEEDEDEDENEAADAAPSKDAARAATS